jgi:hypothetical protein
MVIRRFACQLAAALIVVLVSQGAVCAQASGAGQPIGAQRSPEQLAQSTDDSAKLSNDAQCGQGSAFAQTQLSNAIDAEINGDQAISSYQGEINNLQQGLNRLDAGDPNFYAKAAEIKDAIAKVEGHKNATYAARKQRILDRLKKKGLLSHCDDAARERMAAVSLGGPPAGGGANAAGNGVGGGNLGIVAGNSGPTAGNSGPTAGNLGVVGGGLTVATDSTEWCHFRPTSPSTVPAPTGPSATPTLVDAGPCVHCGLPPGNSGSGLCVNCGEHPGHSEPPPPKVTCTHCGLLTGANSPTCEVCGEAPNGPSKPPTTITCTHCGLNTSANSPTCEVCGEAPNGPSKPPTTVTCTHCGLNTSANSPTCEVCGEANTPEVNCPHCGLPTDANKPGCVNCGEPVHGAYGSGAPTTPTTTSTPQTPSQPQPPVVVLINVKATSTAIATGQNATQIPGQQIKLFPSSTANVPLPGTNVAKDTSTGSGSDPIQGTTGGPTNSVQLTVDPGVVGLHPGGGVTINVNVDPTQTAIIVSGGGLTPTTQVGGAAPSQAFTVGGTLYAVYFLPNANAQLILTSPGGYVVEIDYCRTKEPLPPGKFVTAKTNARDAIPGAILHLPGMHAEGARL